MENTTKRVLAYTLAKEITSEDLVKVSGGKAQWGFTTQGTCGHISGTNGYWDLEADVHVDF